jgi:hypothetical protein
MDNKATTDRTPACNSTYKKLAVQYSADTFVVNQNLVLRINICDKNRQLLVAANSYRQCYKRTVQHIENIKPSYDSENFESIYLIWLHTQL